MNGFDRIAADDNQWASRPLPLTPEQFTQSLWSEVNALKDAISMPRQKVSSLINAFEQGKVSDEEFAILKQLVEKREREAAQVTVTPVDTVQHCSPCSPNPEPSSSVYVKLENTEGKMGPELEELEAPSAGTGLETPGQQYPPNEGIRETGRTNASGILTTGVDSNQGGNIFSTRTESVGTRTSEKSTRITADTTFLQQGHKPSSEQNKQFDPDGKGEKAAPWNAAVTLLSFSEESWEAPCLCFVCLCFVCALFPK